jgi:hypothetical protein
VLVQCSFTLTHLTVIDYAGELFRPCRAEGPSPVSHCAAIEASRVRRRSRSCNRKSTWQETSPLERAQLMQTGEESGTDFSQPRPGGSYDASGSLSRVGTGVSPSVDEQLQGRQTGESGSAGTGRKLDPQSAMLGLSMNGMGVGSGVGGAFGENVVNLFETGRINDSVASQGPPAISSLALQYLRNQQSAPLQPADMIRKATLYEEIPSLDDMSMQPVSYQSTPKRFGIDVFENGVQDSPSIPIDFSGGGPDWFRLAVREEME